MYRTRPVMIIVGMMLLSAGLILAQDTSPANPGCTTAELQQQQEVFASLLTFDWENTPDQSKANLFRLAAQYQQIAVNCGYQPTEQEINALIDFTLAVTDIETILAAQGVGNDVDAILVELESVTGDSFNGQLLYNGIDPGVDGNALGCAGCHNGETAPLTDATWTRVVLERLNEEQFEGYTPERYIVESIVQPDVHIVDGYNANLMPPNFGSRIDIQQMADLIAYLRSQDQGLEDASTD